MDLFKLYGIKKESQKKLFVKIQIVVLSIPILFVSIMLIYSTVFQSGGKETFRHMRFNGNVSQIAKDSTTIKFVISGDTLTFYGFESEMYGKVLVGDSIYKKSRDLFIYYTRNGSTEKLEW